MSVSGDRFDDRNGSGDSAAHGAGAASRGHDRSTAVRGRAAVVNDRNVAAVAGGIADRLVFLEGSPAARIMTVLAPGKQDHH